MISDIVTSHPSIWLYVLGVVVIVIIPILRYAYLMKQSPKESEQPSEDFLIGFVMTVIILGVVGYAVHDTVHERQIVNSVQENLEQNLAATKIMVEHTTVDDDDVIASVTAIINTNERVQFEALYDVEHDVMIPLIDVSGDTIVEPLSGSSLEQVLQTAEQSDGTADIE